MKKTTKSKKATPALKKPAKKKEVKKKAVKKSKKDEQALVVVTNPTNPTQQFLVSSELADDDAIEAELMGRAMEHYVYSFTEKGKTVTGMTVAGVNEMSRQLTKNSKSGIKIRIVPDSIKIEQNIQMGNDLGVSVYLIAENMLTGETAIGSKFEAYKKTGKNGSYPNTFALEKAVSKAERNAKRKLIPEKVAIEMIKKFVKSGKVQDIPESRADYYAPPAETIEPPKINYLAKFLSTLAREAGINHKQITKPDLEKMLDLFNQYTGGSLQSLRVSDNEAKNLLNEFLNCPKMMNK